MAQRARNQPALMGWSAAIGVSPDEVKTAWEDLRRRGLVARKRGKVTVSPLTMRRATTDVLRRLAAHLSSYLLTENPYIVRRAGDPPSLAYILNTRLSVEHIASYFKSVR